MPRGTRGSVPRVSAERQCHEAQCRAALGCNAAARGEVGGDIWLAERAGRQTDGCRWVGRAGWALSDSEAIACGPDKPGGSAAVNRACWTAARWVCGGEKQRALAAGVTRHLVCSSGVQSRHGRCGSQWLPALGGFYVAAHSGCITPRPPAPGLAGAGQRPRAPLPTVACTVRAARESSPDQLCRSESSAASKDPAGRPAARTRRRARAWRDD